MADWLIVVLTGLALLGTGAVAFFGVKARADSANGKAGRALTVTDLHDVRLREVETGVKVGAAQTNALCERVDEIRADVKTILERLPRR